MTTPSGLIKFSDIKSLMPGTFTNFNSSMMRNFNLQVPQSGIIKLSDLKSKYPFPTINAPSTSISICYSTRKIIATYTGPIFKARRSSDNVLQDFYSDNKQSYLTTNNNNTGTTFDSWIGANTAYIYTWYDQSTNAKNATNTTNNTTQPNIIKLVNNFYAVEFKNTNSTVLNITATSGYTVFCHFYNTNSSYGAIITTSTYYEVRFGGASGTNINGDSGGDDWYYSSSGTKLAYNNGASSTTILINGWNVLSLSVSTLSQPTNGFNRIGTDSYSATRALNGYMIDMFLHNSAKSVSDMVAYYNNVLFQGTPVVLSFPTTNAPATSMNLCCSIRLIIQTYTGPVFKARRSNDNALQDFYSDNKQSYLTTNSNNTGTSFATWVGANNAYIYTWYNQIGSNHPVNTVNTTQPMIKQISNYYVVYFDNNTSDSLLTIPTAIKISSIFCQTYNTSSNFGTIMSGLEYHVAFGGNSGIKLTGDDSYDINVFVDWSSCYFDTGINSLNYNNNLSSTKLYLNNWNLISLYAANNTDTTIHYSDLDTIGYDNIQQDIPGIGGFGTNYVALLSGKMYDANAGITYYGDRTTSFKGYMTEIITYKSGISKILTSDANGYKTNSLIINYPSIFNSPLSIMCCYSVRKFISTYSGPVFKLRRSSDNVLQDFYTDKTQSYLTTGNNNTGTTFATWIGANTAYIYTWYDQSINAKDAINTTNNTTQPILFKQTNNYYTVNFITSSLTKLTNTLTISPLSVFSHFYNTNTNQAAIISNSTVDFSVRFGNASGTRIDGDSNTNDWYYSGSVTKLAYNNGVSSTSVLLNGWNVLSESITNSLRPLSPFDIIGKDNLDNTKGMNGYMTEVIMFSTPSIANDMTTYYNNRLF